MVDPIRQAELDVLAAAKAAGKELESLAFSQPGRGLTERGFMLAMINVINASRHLDAVKAQTPEIVAVDLSAPEESKVLIEQLYTCITVLFETAVNLYDGESMIVTDGLEEIHDLVRDLYLQNGGSIE